ncbi:MAG: hypothetical protein JXA69_16585 [Phycisphaerae bacterium]|nr:hypothetical protein [Phycisphaerae bacterium]
MQVLTAVLMMATAIGGPQSDQSTKTGDCPQLTEAAASKLGTVTYLSTTRASGVRFAAVDVFVDTGETPLAAYQCEIKAIQGDVKIVGIEGNAAVAAFAEPPYYDPKAMLEERLILAAFSTQADLPKGKVRVATIHVRIAGDVEPEYAIQLTAAASADGKPINAEADLIQGGTR